MSPFIGHPQGISRDSLELLDRALARLWWDQVLKSADAVVKTGERPNGSPAEKTTAPAAAGEPGRSPAKR
jgi:hypothetical protein